MFDLQNMVAKIKKIPGYNNTDVEYFGYTFDYIIKKRNLGRNGMHLNFDETRVSKVLNHAEHLYASICNITKEPNAKELFIDSANANFKLLFDTIEIKTMVESLMSLMNEDQAFDKKVKNVIEKLYLEGDYKLAYSEFLFYAVQIEASRRECDNKLDIKTNKVKNRVNKSIIADIVFTLTSEHKKIEDIKHRKTWTIDDKIKRNKINSILSMRIKSAYEEYESVMDTLDDICNANTLAKKYLFSHYAEVYSIVLNDVLKNDITEDNILNESSVIFDKVNSYIFVELFSTKKLEFEIEAIKYNLFALTVAVFYQCKFLLPMEEQDDNY